MYNIMKNKILLMILLLLIGILFTGCGLRYVVNSTRYLRRADAREFKINKEAVDSIRKIDIHTSIGDVELIPSDSYYVEIDYLYWEEEPDYSIKDGVLYFDDSETLPHSYSINFNINNMIKIYLPEAALEDVYISNSSGDIEIDGIVADNMDLSVSYGDLSIKNTAAADADISLSSGTSKIYDFQAAELKYTNSYGDARFENINIGDSRLPNNVAFDKIDISMSSGNIDITELNTKYIEITNSYGNVNCEDITAEEFDASLSSGDLNVSKADIMDVDVDNSYGDATLKMLGSASDYSLDLSTSYGKIKVGNKEYEESMSIDNEGTRKLTASLSSGDVIIKFEN